MSLLDHGATDWKGRYLLRLLVAVATCSVASDLAGARSGGGLLMMGCRRGLGPEERLQEGLYTAAVAPAVEDLLSAETGALLARGVMAAPPPPHDADSASPSGPQAQPLPCRLQPPKTQMLVFCNVPDPHGQLMPTDNIGATGDPLADCADFWQHTTGSTAPALQAYQDTYSQIQVFPADHAVPSTC